MSVCVRESKRDSKDVERRQRGKQKIGARKHKTNLENHFVYRQNSIQQVRRSAHKTTKQKNTFDALAHLYHMYFTRTLRVYFENLLEFF